jgi:proprotein convertase subtilisin/kexin type 5
VGCLRCLNDSLCYDCLPGFALAAGQCSSLCLPRKYLLNSTCSPCPYDCYYCSGGSCLSCNATTDFREFNGVTRRCQPLQGYFESNITVALQCPSSCLSCESLSRCTACLNNFFMRTDSLCYSTCLDRYYPDLKTLSCLSCPYDCLTCGSSSNCLSCSGAVDHRELNLTTARCVPLLGYY